MLAALAFAGFFAALAGLALWRYPICGLYLYLLAFYVHPPSRWWGASLPDLRWSLLSAAVTALALFIHRNKLAPTGRTWTSTVPGLVLLLFVLWLWVQNLWALDEPTHLNASFQYTKYIIAFYFMWRLADTPQKITDVLLAHVAGCTYLGWLCFERGRDLGDRLNGVGGPGIDDANSLGMVLATGVLVGIFIIVTQNGWRRIACALGLPFVLNGLVLSGSRGAFLGMVAGGIALYVLRPLHKRWMFWGVAALGALMAVQLVDTKFVDRIFSIKSAVDDPGTRDGSAENRVVLVEAQFKMFAAYPWGSGHRGTAALSPFYLDEEWLTSANDEPAARSSHNTFMTVLTEQGIPGIILYFWIVLWGAGTVIRLKLLQGRGGPPELISPAAACCAGLVVVLVAGNFTDYLLAEVQIWFFALLAVALNRMQAEGLAPARSAAGSLSRSTVGVQ